MRASKLRLLATLLLGALLVSRGQAQTDAKQAKAGKTVHLLTIGNSFSGNATRYLNDITKAAGHKLVYRTCSVGGSPIALHWGKVEAHEKDAKDPAGLYGKVSLKETLAAEPWDFITFQQASIQSHDVNTYRPYAEKMHAFLKKQAPKSEIVLHETWAYRVDDPRFAKPSGKPNDPTTQKGMYDGLKNAYETIAGELGIRIIPVGDAFYRADTDPKWGYKPDPKFDRKSATELPNQKHSLHVGYNWSKAKDKNEKTIGMDGHHANAAGEYLGGLVFFEFIFGETCVGNSFAPKGVEPEFARFLQETAHKAVEDRRKAK